MMISHKLFLIFLQKLFAKDNFIPPFIARLLCLLSWTKIESNTLILTADNEEDLRCDKCHRELSSLAHKVTIVLTVPTRR